MNRGYDATANRPTMTRANATISESESIDKTNLTPRLRGIESRSALPGWLPRMTIRTGPHPLGWLTTNCSGGSWSAGNV